MDACCFCRYYRVGALELAGYVGCRRNRISLRESAPRFGPGGEPAYLWRESLGEVWVRADAAESCGRPNSQDRLAPDPEPGERGKRGPKMPGWLVQAIRRDRRRTDRTIEEIAERRGVSRGGAKKVIYRERRAGGRRRQKRQRVNESRSDNR